MANQYGGAGDTARTIQLPWGAEPRPRRGPRPRLSVPRITEAAIADAAGLEAVSMRRVAERLGGVAPMTL